MYDERGVWIDDSTGIPDVMMPAGMNTPSTPGYHPRPAAVPQGITPQQAPQPQMMGMPTPIGIQPQAAPPPVEATDPQIAFPSITKQLTQPEVAQGFNALSKPPPWTAGRIAQTALTAPIKGLAGILAELHGALGIPTVEDSAARARALYGNPHKSESRAFGVDVSEEPAFGDRFMGVFDGSSRREETAGMVMRQAVGQNNLARKNDIKQYKDVQDIYKESIETRRALQKEDLERKYAELQEILKARGQQASITSSYAGADASRASAENTRLRSGDILTKRTEDPYIHDPQGGPTGLRQSDVGKSGLKLYEQRDQQGFTHQERLERQDFTSEESWQAYLRAMDLQNKRFTQQTTERQAGEGFKTTERQAGQDFQSQQKFDEWLNQLGRDQAQAEEARRTLNSQQTFSHDEKALGRTSQEGIAAAGRDLTKSEGEASRGLSRETRDITATTVAEKMLREARLKAKDDAISARFEKEGPTNLGPLGSYGGTSMAAMAKEYDDDTERMVAKGKFNELVMKQRPNLAIDTPEYNDLFYKYLDRFGIPRPTPGPEPTPGLPGG